MPTKLNTEFNYRFQVEGNTPWEKIKHLQGFLEGRERAAALEQVSAKKYQARLSELEYLRRTGAEEYVILGKEAELLEIESFKATETAAYELNRQEIQILKRLLAELYEAVEHTRAVHDDGTPYTDDEMFELNAANEFTAMIGKEIYAEIAAGGRPSPAKIRNAMSNPYTMQALKKCGLLPEQLQYLEPNADPRKIELVQTIFNQELAVPSLGSRAVK